jgi:Kef-type K+ transport system membrane component KefB
MIGETGEAINGTRELLRQMVFYIFSPLFFASMGLRANFITHFDLPLVFGLLMVAVFAKFVGAASELISAANRGTRYSSLVSA